ncbi:MAG: alpha/beta hydrolase, partial [Anaerolineaceae bacterium]|nr:alpha/beta hydrolase [Anaerolineaceae bacterium]
ADLDFFAPSFTAVSFDYLGTGLSDRIEHTPSDWFRDCADQAVALIEHLDLGPAILLGTSGGAVIALHGAADHSNRVRAVIADSFTPVFTPQMLQGNVIDERSNPTEDQAAFWRFAHGEDWRAVVEADTQMLRDMVDKGGQWLGDSLARVACPVLLTFSLEDPMLVDPVKYGFEILSQLPDGRIFFNPKGGHPLIWSAPEAFRQAIQGFLGQFL